jgi:small-conductance mechanosensitive channel
MRRASFSLVAMVFAVGVWEIGPALGQGQPGLPAEAPTAQVEAPAAARAPVVIDGEVLFNVRGITAYPAERRAAEIEARIRALARDRADAPSLTLQDQTGATWILANGRPFLIVHDEDAALEVVDRRILAEAYRARVLSAIAAYRAARQPAILWRHALLALGATLVLLAGAYTCGRIAKLLRERLERRYREQVGDITVLSFQVVRADQLWRALAGLLTFVWGFTVIAMVAVYLRYTLALFPWTRGTANGLVDIVTEPLRRMGLGLVSVIPNIVFLAILFLVTRYVLKLFRLFFDSVAAGTVRLHNFDRDWAQPTFKIVRLLVVAFAVVVAYPYVPGSDTDAFKGVSLFIGVVFSLGSTSLIGNIISGYSLTYRRTFRIGDRVRIGEHVGEVMDMRMLVTHLRTPWNEEVIVPNASIVGTEVVNFSSMVQQRGLILHTTVGIGYETPWRQVEAMLIEAAARTRGLLRDRPPFVHQKSLGDFCVTYELNAFCDTPDRMRFLYTDLHRNILDVFNEYGVQIMTPAYEGDPDRLKVVPKERWYAEPARPPANGQDAIDA